MCDLAYLPANLVVWNLVVLAHANLPDILPPALAIIWLIIPKRAALRRDGGGMAKARGDIAQERVLFELWQDACQLDRFLARSRLTREGYLATPLARATPLRILGIVGIHAGQADSRTRSSLPGIDLAAYEPYAALAQEGAVYQADEPTLERLWSEGICSVPSLRAALANDPRVVRQRTEWDRLALRSPTDWPQPPMLAAGADPALEGLDRAMAPLLEGLRPALGLWSLAVPSDGPSPSVFALQTDGRLTDSQAMEVLGGLRSALGGIEVELIPQEAIHPLLWDELVGRERLVWRRDGIGDVALVPSAMASGHHRHEE